MRSCTPGLRRWAVAWRAQRRAQRERAEAARRRAAAVVIAVALRRWIAARRRRCEVALAQHAAEAALVIALHAEV